MATSRSAASDSAIVAPAAAPRRVLPPTLSIMAQSASEELAATLDALEILTYTEPEAALAAATEAQEAARRIDHVDLVLRARLVQADALFRTGETANAGRIAHEVNDWAIEHGPPHLLARSHRRLAWFFHLNGDESAHLEHAIGAVEHLDEHSPDRMRAVHTLALAAALVTNGSFEEARTRFQVAEELAVSVGDVGLQFGVLSNRSYGEYLAGDAGASMAAAERMLALAATHDVALDTAALDTVARAQMGLGRYVEAEQTLLSGLAVFEVGDGMREGDDLAEILLTLAQTQRLLGDGERVRDTLDRCMSLCDERGLFGVRVRVLRERAELFAIEGAYREAFEQHKVYHAAAEALLSAEHDVRARTLQAVFETGEARRAGRRFREMSMHDPLTGLYNRRYADDRLDSLLQEGAVTGAPLSICLVDVDYFKRVNDTFSHEVGDDVLKEIAGLLAAAVTEPAYAARMGGEEFLLVLPGVSGAEAAPYFETTRLELHSHDWSGLNGRLAITASFGVTSVSPGRATRTALLRRADRNLYAAKRGGRDQVVGDPA